MFSIIFIPEFARDGSVESPSVLYAKLVGRFRYVDVGILAIAFLHFLAGGVLRKRRLTVPRSLAMPGAGFLACIAVSAVYGTFRGGTNIFFDWRGLALGMALYVVWAFWLQDAEEVGFCLRLFAAYTGLRIAFLYILFAFGVRDTLLGVSIPVFDGPVLSAIVFAGLLGSTWYSSEPSNRRFLWAALAIGAGLMVVLCLRRTYWAELGIGGFILALLQKQHRGRNLLAALGVVCVAALLLGSSLQSRLQSFDPTGDTGQFSADNADHVNDLLDAWEQVRQLPFLGLGLGTSYPTWRIRHWKAESVMVHNAPLHVWLKYGLAGLICYIWFHIALLRWLYRQIAATAAPARAFLTAAFAYVAAEFIVTLGFAPWPYSELQLTTLLSLIVAASIAVARQPHFANRFDTA